MDRARKARKDIRGYITACLRKQDDRLREAALTAASTDPKPTGPAPGWTEFGGYE